MSLIRSTHGGKEYDAQWNKRQRGDGPIAEAAAARFQLARRRFGFNKERRPLDTTKFKAPPQAGVLSRRTPLAGETAADLHAAPDGDTTAGTGV